MGPGTDTDVVTTISSTAKAGAPDVKVTEVKGPPLTTETLPSGNVNPVGMVPVKLKLKPVLAVIFSWVVFVVSSRANKKLIAVMGTLKVISRGTFVANVGATLSRSTFPVSE
jgi:hypothetical protein